MGDLLISYFQAIKCQYTTEELENHMPKAKALQILNLQYNIKLTLKEIVIYLQHMSSRSRCTLMKNRTTLSLRTIFMKLTANTKYNTAKGISR